METSLYIGKEEFPPKSARGCTQELKLIDIGKKERTINGELIKWNTPKKFWTKIICSDVNIPSILDLSIGELINIGCIQKLWKKVNPNSPINLNHDPVEDSIIGHDENGKSICTLPTSKNINPSSNITFISYRPWISMFITKLETETKEWKLKSSWMLEAEEL